MARLPPKRYVMRVVDRVESADGVRLDLEHRRDNGRSVDAFRFERATDGRNPRLSAAFEAAVGDWLALTWGGARNPDRVVEVVRVPAGCPSTRLSAL